MPEETGNEDIHPEEPFIPYTGDGPRSGVCQVCKRLTYPTWGDVHRRFCRKHLREVIVRATWPNPPRALFDG